MNTFGSTAPLTSLPVGYLPAFENGINNTREFNNNQKPKTRPRRKYHEIDRLYICGFKGCIKGYGTLNHLNAHVLTQNHGDRRRPEEFKEIRRIWRKQKREEEQFKQKEFEKRLNDPISLQYNVFTKVPFLHNSQRNLYMNSSSESFKRSDISANSILSSITSGDNSQVAIEELNGSNYNFNSLASSYPSSTQATYNYTLQNLQPQSILSSTPTSSLYEKASVSQSQATTGHFPHSYQFCNNFTSVTNPEGIILGSNGFQNNYINFQYPLQQSSLLNYNSDKYNSIAYT